MLPLTALLSRRHDREPNHIAMMASVPDAPRSSYVPNPTSGNQAPSFRVVVGIISIPSRYIHYDPKMTYPYPPPWGAVPLDAPTVPEPPAARRRSLPAWVIWSVSAALVLGLLGAGFWMWWSEATTTYREATVAYDAAFADAADAANGLRAEVLTHQTQLADVQSILDVAGANEGLVSLESVEALTTTHAALTASVTDTLAVSDEAPTALPPEELAWPWEYANAAAVRTSAAADAAIYEDTVGTAEDDITTAHRAMLDDANTLWESVPDHAAALEAAHLAARRGDVIGFRSASDDMSREISEDSISSTAPTRFTAYASAAATLRTSAAEELAEKAGPLFETRLEVEAFARSLAGGVLLDFDWAESVNGAGPDGRVGGTASWDGGSGGSATITLSNSVAERWPDDVPKALVAHEVGHAMSGRCYDMFDWESRDENEAWATAWALSMGYTADGNGVSIYGYPRQELIDIAATCR